MDRNLVVEAEKEERDKELTKCMRYSSYVHAQSL